MTGNRSVDGDAPISYFVCVNLRYVGTTSDFSAKRTIDLPLSTRCVRSVEQILDRCGWSKNHTPPVVSCSQRVFGLFFKRMCCQSPNYA